MDIMIKNLIQLKDYIIIKYNYSTVNIFGGSITRGMHSKIL